jgi:hypothetical protein
VDDQEALLGLDSHHFQQDAVRVGAEEHDAVVPKWRILRRGLADDRVSGVDDMAAAFAADSMFCCRFCPSDVHRGILSDTI